MIARTSRPPCSTEDERYLIGDSTVAHYDVVDEVARPAAPR
jgi:hypothetical protein